MKKLTVAVICLALLAAVAGCATTGGSTAAPHVDGTLPDILHKMYENLDPSVQLPFLMEAPLTHEGTAFNPSVSYFIGSNDVPFKEGLVSEAAIGAQAYSVVLLRMESGADINAAMNTIRTTVDPWKWICVGVDPSDVIVDNIGDLIILIMSDYSRQLHEAFRTLAV